MDRVGAAEVSAADDLSGSGEGLELEAPATFWGKSGDGRAGLSLNYKRTHPTNVLVPK